MGRLALVICVTFWLSGCGLFSQSHPEPSVTGVIKLVVKGADYLNPDTYGRPCPVVIKLYELPECQVFRNYRFLDLYNRADHFLGAQMLYIRELSPLHPGQVVQLDIPLVNGAGCLAALAGYSQFMEGTPSATLPIKSSGSAQLTVEGLRVVLTGEQ